MSTALRRFDFDITLADRTTYRRSATSPANAILVLWGERLQGGDEDNRVVSIRQAKFPKELIGAARRELFTLVRTQLPRMP